MDNRLFALHTLICFCILWINIMGSIQHVLWFYLLEYQANISKSLQFDGYQSYTL